MKNMIKLQTLIDKVENDILDADSTLIDTSGIATLDEEFGIESESDEPEDTEETVN